MASAELQAGIRITAGVDGAEQIKTLADEIQAAGLDTAKLSEEAQKLHETFTKTSQQQALIEQYKALEKELEETGRAMKAADTLLDGLHESMKDGATDEQKEAVAKLRSEMEKLAKKETELAEKVRDSRNAMTAAGVSVKKLAADEQRLATEASAAAVKMDKLAAEAQELKAIADARIQLGLDTDDKARQEIEKTKQAYETLKNSGTLSHAELARAAELQRDKVYKIERSLSDLRPTLADVADELQGVVTKAGGLAYVGREAVKFESAMAGVKKVVDGTPEQIAELSGEIKRMAGELGVVPEQLAEIAAQGGQLGVALDRLPEFTEMAAKMSVAFGISAQEAGDAAATIANVFQLPIEEVERLGDAVNTLGNNTAAREKDIIAAMTRIGGTAKQFGLAAEEAAALSGAFIALGKPPEVAATAINALLQKLQTAQSQGKDFQTALSQIGLSADDMAANIAANPQKALSEFLGKLQQLDKQSRALVLSDLFGAEYSDDIALLVGSLGEYEKALGLVSDKAQTLGAMQNEFAAAMDTAEGRLNQAKASFQAAAATIGEALLPAISAVASGAARVADTVGSVAEQFPVLTQLAVMYAGLRVGMQALGTVARLTGATSVRSMLQAEVGTKKFSTQLLAAKAAAAALNTELGKTAARDLDILKNAAGGLKDKLAQAAHAAAGIGIALSTGTSVGEWAYQSFTPVRALGDELGRALAYVDAIFTDRTFDDVSKHFKTSAQAARELAEAEKAAAKAKAERAEADAKAAAAESARITAMQQQYRSLKTEHDAVAASMKVLQSEGLGNGEIYVQLATQADGLRAEMEKLNAELNKAGADFKFDTGAIAEAKNALKDLGLTAEQVSSGISEEAAKGLAAFDKAAVQFGHDSEQMARIFQAALSKMDSPEAVEALRKRLEDVGKQAGLTAEEIAKIGEKAPDVAAKVSEAFAKIGVDAEAATTGISSKAKEAFADWQAASAAAKDAGIEDARLIRNGFEQMMGKLQSRAEFEAFRAQLQKSGDAAALTKEQIQRLNDAAKEGAAGAKTAYDAMAQSIKTAAAAADLSRVAAEAKAAFEAGTITAAQYDQVLVQVKQRTAELEAQSAKAGDTAANAHNKAAAAADNHARAAQGAGKSNKELVDGMGKVAGASESATRKVNALHQGISSTYGVVKLTREEFVRYNNLLHGLTEQGTHFLRKGWRAYADQFLNSIKEANRAQEELNAAISDGTVNMGHLIRATNAAGAAAGKLDKAGLANLQNSIEAARQKLVQLKDEATDARLSIEAELAAINGDEEAGYALQQQRKLAELRAKQQAADKNGQSDVAGEWARALQAQETLYARQKEQRQREKAEEEQRQREAAAINKDGGSRLNLGDLDNLKLDGLGDAASSVIKQLESALNARDAKVVEKAGQELLNQLQAGLQRMS
ncbi:phage tail tape measure protein [Neisseria dumasiana]|uniref:Phage tail tape measure protein n=1 Tax=Neisseria dumasiana TaxID=1931275 RepID=A0ABX3WPJ8_9NEIS|nr:phage tail tape measure protein [Neisseria dumasiana]OSI36081.1 phage tail tape measure protein [Neisseria dumasiana]UOO83555.1 phage tail tape measure protein [Neisseria dumasiana]